MKRNIENRLEKSESVWYNVSEIRTPGCEDYGAVDELPTLLFFLICLNFIFFHELKASAEVLTGRNFHYGSSIYEAVA